MARTKRTTLPGTFYQRGKARRWYWRVRLPNEDKATNHPLRWRAEKATTDEAEAHKIAEHLYQQSLADSLGVETVETKQTASAAPTPTAEQVPTLTVAELVKQYQAFAAVEYGGRSKEPTSIKYAVAPLVKLYGNRQASTIRPAQLLKVRESMVDDGLSRKTINDRISILRRLYCWAAERELVAAETHYRLTSVKPLRRNRGGAKESKKVLPVEAEVVEATAEFASPVVADMMRLQLLSGMRSGELVIMRPCDVDTSADVWLYRPMYHKTEHFGHERIVPLGSDSQAIVAKYLSNRKPTAFCFSPKESYELVKERRSQERTTPMSCGNRPGSNVSDNPQVKRGNRYSSDTYRQAIERAIDRANYHRKPNEQLPIWHPHQLRHTASTQIRAEHGLDAARVILGHRTLQMADH